MKKLIIMLLEEFLELQEKDIEIQFRENMSKCLAATTKERLYEHAKSYNWKLNYVAHTDKNKVILVTKKSNLLPEIWVCSTYTCYRNAYKKFLLEYFNISDLPKNYHVDHFLPKGIFKQNHPEYFIRLMLIPCKNNYLFGADTEKLQIHFQAKKGINGGYHVSYINLAKFYGYFLPGRKSTEEERFLWAYDFASFLEKKHYGRKDMLYAGILSLLYNVYRNLELNGYMQTSCGVLYLSA